MTFDFPVISNGMIAEFGDHETLLEKEDGIYRLLCESQGITPSGTSSTSCLRTNSSLAGDEFGNGTKSSAGAVTASTSDIEPVKKNASAVTSDELNVTAIELQSSPS